jgi:hypothetical protein
MMAGYLEEHITCHIGSFSMGFVRRPLEGVQPSDGWLGFVERLENGKRVRAAVGRWRNGLWDNGKGRDLPFTPTHWTELGKSVE